MFQEFSVEEKTDRTDLVTSLDKHCQDIIIQKIKSAFPNDNFLAEENNVSHPIMDGNVWVLDPIDGTANFIAQKDNFAIMLAYYEKGIGQFGLILDVMRDILYHGGGYFDVYANNQLLSPYKEKPLSRQLIGVNAKMYLDNTSDLHDLTNLALGVRIYGGAGISMANVLSGKLFAYFSNISPWDYAAALIMGDKLGYTLLTIDGKEPSFNGREKIMFVPQKQLDFIQTIIKS